MVERRRYNHPLSRLARLRRDPYAAMMYVVGDGSVGGNSVPLTWWRKQIVSPAKDNQSAWLSLSSGDDAFGLTFRRVEGDPTDYTKWNQWEHVYLDLSRYEARVVWWTILTWFVRDWFGLRRRLYYWALTRHLDRVAPWHRRKAS